MQKLKAYNVLVEHVYEAAHRPEAWQTFLEELAKFSGAATGVLTIENIASDDIQIMSAVGFDQSAVEQYGDYYFSIDPWLPYLQDLNRFESTDQLVSLNDIQKTEFHNDWARHAGMYHALAGNAYDMGHGKNVRIAVHRNKNIGEFNSDEVNWINMLAPHIKRALTLSGKLLIAETAAKNALDAIEAAVFLCGVDAKVRDCNVAADELAASSSIFKVLNSHLVFSDHATQSLLTQRLSILVGQSSFAANIQQTEDSPILSKPLDGEQFEILVLPWRKGTHQFIGTDTCAVFIRSFNNKRRVSPQYLQKLFGFTHTEALVAAALVTGVSVQNLAWQMKVKESTTRAHIKSILAKTGCRSQQELISLLLSTLAKYAN